MKWTIPIDFEVVAPTEPKAELVVLDFLKRATLDYGNQYDILNWYYSDFGSTPEEPYSAGCGDNNQCQGQSVQPTKQTCGNTIEDGECSGDCYGCRSVP